MARGPRGWAPIPHVRLVTRRSFYLPYEPVSPSASPPDHEPGSPAATANELGLRNVAFEVDDLQAAVDRLAADGYGLVGGIGQYEHIWRMAYVRGPEGIIVSLAESIG